MGASRQFVDSFGFSWQALEITRDVQPERAVAPDNWLYFLSRGTTRRLRTYPAEWAVMSWADLEDLCTRAEVVGTDSGFLPVHAFSERLKATAGN
jgi:hypothetical protein